MRVNKPTIGAAWRWHGRALALAVVLALAGCSGMFPGSGITVTQTGQSGPAQAVPAGTDPDDEVIGRREHPRIVAAYGGVYRNRQTEIALAEITGRLLAAADQPNAPFTITILDTPDVNAFALPGGYVYVTRGILALASSASEIAAVLSHEIAHVTLKHARARSSRVRTSEIVDRVISGILGGDLSTDQSAARSKLSLAAFSQAQELAADREGIRVAGLAGYNPQAAAQFLSAMGRFQTFAGGAQAGAEDFLSDHPSTPDRIEKAADIARAFNPALPTFDGREAYLKAIDGLQFGNNPHQGAIVGHQFVHPDLGFTFSVPDAYQLQNSSSSVVGVAGDGEAVRFDSAEVPVEMNLVDYLKSGWITGLQPDSVVGESVNGIEMARGEARTDQWVFLVSAVRFKGDVYRFIFAARADTSVFRKAADATVKSFRPTTSDDLKRIRTSVIRLATAKAGDTTASLAAKMANMANARELFLILNNLYDGDPIAPDQTYKIVAVE